MSTITALADGARGDETMGSAGDKLEIVERMRLDEQQFHNVLRLDAYRERRWERYRQFHRLEGVIAELHQASAYLAQQLESLDTMLDGADGGAVDPGCQPPSEPYSEPNRARREK